MSVWLIVVMVAVIWAVVSVVVALIIGRMIWLRDRNDARPDRDSDLVVGHSRGRGQRGRRRSG